MAVSDKEFQQGTLKLGPGVGAITFDCLRFASRWADFEV